MSIDGYVEKTIINPISDSKITGKRTPIITVVNEVVHKTKYKTKIINAVIKRLSGNLPIAKIIEFLKSFENSNSNVTIMV